MSIYLHDWTIEEAKDIGRKFKVKCCANHGYENCLTEGKEYEIEVTPRILPMSPLCSFVGDDGRDGHECHLERFEKLEAA